MVVPRRTIQYYLDEDLSRITLEFQVLGLPHMGVLIVPKSIEGNEYARIAAALAHYATL